jgi:hypothetical protein
VDGNSIDFSTITDSVALANLALDTEFSIGGGNKISQTKGVYEKTSSRGWNAAITSTKGFSGDGCVIAKIGSNNKHLMVGLSTDSNNNEGNYHAINFAIYVHNSGNIVGIYENGRSVKIFSEGQYPYTAGDYLKIERDGTTINYYLVKVGDDPATEGTLLYTSSKILSADTELFLDGSFHDVGAKLSDIQVFNNKLPLSVSAKSIRQVSTTGDLEKNNVFDQVFNEHQFDNDDETGISSDKGESTTDNTNTTNNTTITNNTTDNTQETEEQKTNKAEKWFNSKVNQKFSQGLSFSQTPKILIITELSNENFDLALSLRKNNDIIVYYNAQENEIEYLYGQENDISVRQIEYRIIANSKSINTLVEDTTSGDYIVDIDDDPEDDIDIQAIVAQLQPRVLG